MEQINNHARELRAYDLRRRAERAGDAKLASASLHQEHKHLTRRARAFDSRRSAPDDAVLPVAVRNENEADALRELHTLVAEALVDAQPQPETDLDYFQRSADASTGLA